MILDYEVGHRFILVLLNFLEAMVYFIAILIWRDVFPLDTVPILIGIFFFGSVQFDFHWLVALVCHVHQYLSDAVPGGGGKDD